MIDFEFESGEWGEVFLVIFNFFCSCNLFLVLGVEFVFVFKNSLLVIRCGGYKFI